jgi:NAD(P)-dependent dehydrogenase (short-subunit alcohol dehydrogenase family)
MIAFNKASTPIVSIPQSKYYETSHKQRRDWSYAQLLMAKADAYKIQIPEVVRTKGAIDPLTRSMAFDLAKYNIRVNCLAPGAINTPRLREWINNSTDPTEMEAYPTLSTEVGLLCNLTLLKENHQ